MGHELDSALEKMGRAKDELIHIQDDIRKNLPIRYLKKLNTIIGKLENLELEIYQESVRRK